MGWGEVEHSCRALHQTLCADQRQTTKGERGLATRGPAGTSQSAAVPFMGHAEQVAKLGFPVCNVGTTMPIAQGCCYN